MPRPAAALLLVVLAAMQPLAVHAADPRAGASIEIRSGSFQRAHVVSAGGVEKARRANDLAGTVGWFEYDVNIAADGWHELIVEGHAHDVEVFIDPRGDAPSQARYYVPGSAGYDGKRDKIGNFWLPRGRHTVRLQRYYWTGMPKLTGMALRPSDGRLATSVRVSRPLAYGIHRKSRCAPLEIEYGPRSTPATLAVSWVNAATSARIRSYAVELPAANRHTRLQWPIPCDDEGDFVLYFGGGRETLANRDVHPYSYQVIDTAAGPAATGEIKKTLVQEIDLVSALPDYQGQDTRLVQRPSGAYRESGDDGWLDGRRRGAQSADFSWFAYALKGITPQQPHLVEVDYPDDADRTFVIALRESAPYSYPIAGGVDSGGEFALTNAMQTHALLFWPRAADPRIVFMNARSGKRAAAARVRVYRIEGRLPPLVPPGTPGRHYANWYEEGSNFLGMYGAPDESPGGTRRALERWAQALSYMGGDTLWPTVVVYSFALYPSVYNKAFSQPWRHDLLRQALLVAEQHRMKVIPGLHPRADELAWPYASAPEPKPQLLASRNGENHKDLPPFHNPLLPANQDWYVAMIGELADNYRDSPALGGVSLRFMQWKNPTLHNFHSLDWGYDDATIALFEQETRITVPVEANEVRARSRYRWLMANAREQWIAWRCAKIAQLVTRIRDRVRRARPDLQVYIPVFATTESGSRYNSGTSWLREAGIDAALLGRIDGVVLVNALHGYGRRADAATDALLRSYLTDASSARMLAAPGKLPAFLPGANYFEATEAVVPPEKLGYPPGTKKTWMSAVVNPAGRNALERHALLLAETDAGLLGDGGNTYTLGQPVLREFLAEYRRLPAVPFRPRADARNPVAVWELERGGEYFFYAVNRTAAAVDVQLSFEGKGTLTRLSTGAAVSLRQHNLDLRLAPYQLAAFRAPAELRISRVGAPAVP